MPVAALRRVVDSTGQDFRYAARGLLRSPGFAAVAILSLAAGIGLNTAVFSIINTVFLQEIRGVPDPGRVAFVGARETYPGFRALREQSRSFTGLVAQHRMPVEIRWEGTAVRRVAPLVSDDYFAVLGLRPAAGRFFQPAASALPADAPEAVLDHRFWTETLGGRRDVLGKTILVNDVPLTIVGVAPRAFHGAGPERPPLWVPLGLRPALAGRSLDWADTTLREWTLTGRLRDGVSPAAAAAELRTIAARAPHLFGRTSIVVATGRERWTGAVSAEKRIEFLLVVVVPLVVVGVILWIGCSNVANLLLARAVARRKEIVIRLATGAPRWRLVRLLLAESLLLAAAGGGAGLLLGLWALDLVWATFPEFATLAVEMDGRVLAYTAAVSIVATLLFGLAPALQATRVDVRPALDGGGLGPEGRLSGSRLRGFFLVTQIASSMALLVIAATFVRTLLATYVGEEAARMDRVAVGWLESGETAPEARAAVWARVRREVSAIPGVRGLTLREGAADRKADLLPEGEATRRAGAFVQPGAADRSVLVQRADTTYFPVAGHAVIAGHVPPPAERRAPDAEERGRREPVVVNERAARRFWPGEAGGALGRRFALGGEGAFEVAAVVRDDGRDARVYRMLADGDLAAANVLVVGAGPAAALVPPLRAALVRLAPDPAWVRVHTLRDAALDPLRRLTRMALAVGLLALALAAVGLFGSISFHTTQRTREIAIRVAVGATRLDVLRLLLGHGARVVGAGALLGLALVAVAFRFMGGMIFGEWRLDVVTLAAVAAVFAATTVLASWLPGLRATRVDPITVLRSD